MSWWSRKPSLEDQVIDLKMSSRTLNSQYKRCMNEAAKYEKMVKSEVMKGNQDIAAMYAQSAVRMRGQGKQFMMLSSRLEIAALNLQSVSNMSSVSKAMASSVAAIKAASTSLDVSKMYKVMDQFKQACEDSEVQMAGFETAMGTQSVGESDEAQQLIDKISMEVANANGNTATNVPYDAGAQQQQQAQQPQAQAMGGDTADLFNRLNNL